MNVLKSRDFEFFSISLEFDELDSSYWIKIYPSDSLLMKKMTFPAKRKEENFDDAYRFFISAVNYYENLESNFIKLIQIDLFDRVENKLNDLDKDLTNQISKLGI